MDCAASKHVLLSDAIVGAYVVCGVVSYGILSTVGGFNFSSILTISVVMQCFGVALLCIQVTSNRSAAGLSAAALVMEGIAFACRLSSTVHLHGYLPSDASGDLAYQLVDACSLALVLWLLYKVLVVHRSTYEAAQDSFPVVETFLGCLVLAAILHGDMDDHPVFDTLWMAGLFVESISVLPQLLHVMKTSGEMKALTCHFIIAQLVSKLLSAAFMWHARFHITCVQWIEGVEHAIIAILIAHALHFILLGDFAVVYVRAVLRQGFSQSIQLNGDWV